MNDPILDQTLGQQTGMGSPRDFSTSNMTLVNREVHLFRPHFPHVIDSSMMGALKSCEEKFNKEYIQHWKPRDQSVHLHAGAAFAKGLEIARDAFFVKGCDSDESIARGLQALLTAYGDFECPEDSAKSASRMAGAYEFYWSNYPLERTGGEGEPITLPSGRRGIEFSFAHPLPINHPETGDPLLYVGRLDMLFNFAGGIFMEDDKTTSQLGASWSRQWDLRSQFTGYAWGCEQSGIHVDGAVIRGVSILKTKYDTQQAISYRPEWQIQRWYEELLFWIDRALSAYRSGRYLHNLDHACAEYGGCTFRQCCSSQDEAPWLEANFERREWDPVMRTETKL